MPKPLSVSLVCLPVWLPTLLTTISTMDTLANLRRQLAEQETQAADLLQLLQGKLLTIAALNDRIAEEEKKLEKNEEKSEKKKNKKKKENLQKQNAEGDDHHDGHEGAQ